MVQDADGRRTGVEVKKALNYHRRHLRHRFGQGVRRKKGRDTRYEPGKVPVVSEFSGIGRLERKHDKVKKYRLRVANRVIETNCDAVLYISQQLLVPPPSASEVDGSSVCHS